MLNIKPPLKSVVKKRTFTPLRFLRFILLFIICTPFTLHAIEQEHVPHNGSAEKAVTLHLASTDWCPYVCDDKDNPGFIVEYLKELFSLHNITLMVTIVPWSRAIHMAQNGHVDGLVTATEAEAPGFHLTHTPAGAYQMCFFSKKADTFVYTGRKSLSGRVIGAIKDYGYGEPVDSMIAQPKDNEKIIFLSTSSPLYSLVGMLEMSRFDLFIEDSTVVEKFLNDSPNTYDIRKAGCLEKVPFYTAISPKYKQSKQLVDKLNNILDSNAANLYRQKARQHYGLAVSK